MILLRAVIVLLDVLLATGLFVVIAQPSVARHLIARLLPSDHQAVDTALLDAVAAQLRWPSWLLLFAWSMVSGVCLSL